MSQSLSKVLLHIVFSTKNRTPWIKDALRPKIHAYIAQICRNEGSEAYRVGGIEDHIHIACTLSRTLTISKLLEEVKRSSSAWIKQQDSACKEFSWQAGYGVFSLGQSQLPSLIALYLYDIDFFQDSKHKINSHYKDLFRKFLSQDYRYLRHKYSEPKV